VGCAICHALAGQLVSLVEHRQVRVVALDHRYRRAALFRDCVDVGAAVDKRLRDVEVSQRVEGACLVRPRAGGQLRVLEQLAECLVQVL
jgi:hypothetical protein